MSDEMMEALCQKLASTRHIEIKDIPNIDLYMDQVTTFMEQQLSSCRRYEQDKIMTKTMINNYTKNKLLPAPEKKKYSSEHIMLLSLIYYYKNFLSISDIQKLLTPLIEKYFHATNVLNLNEIYETFFSLEPQQMKNVQDDIRTSWERSKQVFQEESKEDREELQQLTFISLLSLDVYLKKMMIEQVIDSIQHQNAPSKAKEHDAKLKKSLNE